MQSTIDLSYFYQLLIIFSLSVVVIALCHRLKIPESLAYLCVGLVLGPGILNIIGSTHQIDLLAEMGVVFLLFSLGLEFSLSKVIAMRHLVFGLGGMQVLISTVIISLIGFTLGLPTIATLIVAAGLSLSSTAIVSKELTRRNEIRTPFGEAVLGTLIFQDIAAVIFLIIISAIASGTGGDHLSISLLFSFVKGILFVLGMIVIGKKVLPYIFNEVATTRSEELFVLTAIVVALLAAMFSNMLGLSMALGGFVAGMMLGESRYRHQVETDIRPFRDILLGLFFVSIGLMLNIKLLIDNWWVILLGAAGLILFKVFLVNILSRFIGLNRKNSLKTALSLAQGGEFCFAVVALASQYDLLSDKLGSLILSIAILSMVATPFLIRYSEQLSQLFLGKKVKRNEFSNDVASVQQATSSIEGHILICGYGRVGQVVSRFIRDDDIPYIALDDDPLHVKEATKAKEPVFFGDCRRTDILKATGISRAKMAVICLDNAKTANQVLLLIRQINPLLPVLVRTRDDRMMEVLYKNGATRLIPEVLESSLLVVSEVLTMLGKPELEIRQRIQAVRQKKYRRLHGFFIGQTESLYTPEGAPADLRHGFTLDSDCFAVGKSLDSIELDKAGAEIDKVIRDKKQLDPEDAGVLEIGDLLLITGPAKAIFLAEEVLCKGKL